MQKIKAQFRLFIDYEGDEAATDGQIHESHDKKLD